MRIVFKERENDESFIYTEMIEEIECVYIEDNKIEMMSMDGAYYTSDRNVDFCEFDYIRNTLLKDGYIDFINNGLSFTRIYEEDYEDEGNTPENSNPPEYIF